MGGPLAHLGSDERARLLDDLNYLNLQEIRTLCDRHAIPYRVLVETVDGGTRPTTDTDRKPVILRRVRRFLATGKVPEATRLPSGIVREDAPPARLRPTDRLYYRWYDKTYGSVMDLLKELTGGSFRNGALARVLIMEFWTAGEAPTFAEFADAWSSAKESRDLVTPEYAFLTDLQRGRAGPEWKALRRRKAERVLTTLEAISADRPRR